MSNTLQMNSFIAVDDDGEGVLGKILYYSLSSILVEKEKLSQICGEIGFPVTVNRRVAQADAFRSATGDISDSKTVKVPGGAEVYKIYCRDNYAKNGEISRELVKETLDTRTNDYKKLANITFSKDAGMSYDDLMYDEHVDPLGCDKEPVIHGITGSLISTDFVCKVSILLR